MMEFDALIAPKIIIYEISPINFSVLDILVPKDGSVPAASPIPVMTTLWANVSKYCITRDPIGATNVLGGPKAEIKTANNANPSREAVARRLAFRFNGC